MRGHPRPLGQHGPLFRLPSQAGSGLEGKHARFLLGALVPSADATGSRALVALRPGQSRVGTGQEQDEPDGPKGAVIEMGSMKRF